MTAPTVTALPTAPQRTDDPSVFSDRADAWVSALDTYTTEINALGDYVETEGAIVDSAVAIVQASSGLDQFRGAWDSGTAYVTGDSVYLASNGKYYIALQSGTNQSPDVQTGYWSEVLSQNALDLYGRWTGDAVSTAATVDCADGNHFYAAISANTTFNFTNLPASGRSYSWVLEVAMTGDRTVAFTHTITWRAGVAPTPLGDTTTLFLFLTRDGGTTIYGAAVTNL